MSVTKIQFEVLERDARDAQRLPQYFEVQFNPTQYTLAKAAKYDPKPGASVDTPFLNYTGGQSGSLSLSLLFDTTRQGGLAKGAHDVRTKTSLRYVRELVRMQPRTHSTPRVQLIWGSGLTFKGYAESLQEQFTLFAPDGTPVRATANLSLKELGQEAPKAGAPPNLQSPDHTRTRIVQQGDTLCGITEEEYQDPSLWRHVADANRDRLPDPRRLAPGTVLRLPPFTFEDRRALT